MGFDGLVESNFHQLEVKKLNKKLLSVVLGILFLVPFVVAETTVAEITEPLTKIYDLVKAAVTIVALIAITYAGGKMAMSGDNIPAREGAKSILTYSIAGLVMVWVAPLLVNFLSAPPV